ncbi:hypothetical protein [Pseudomonas sp. LRF_L74]|uniref:hypothetical protein n=1 Tax=Pseudomonas sp. LRF_L74 TaxID=3369422 RepID=UPI003F641DB0
MMHADLIDQEDFRDRLLSLGVFVPGDASAAQACELAILGMTPDRAAALKRMVEDMLGSGATILPAVREAISRNLLPALVKAH